MQSCKARLVLNMEDILSGSNSAVTNDVGTVNADHTQKTWNRINQQTLLGDLFHKHDKFNIQLTSALQLPWSGNIANSVDDLFIQFEMSGLQFINNTYSVKNQCNQHSAILGQMEFVSGGQDKQFYDSNMLTFQKESMSSISINFKNLYGTLPTLANGEYFPSTSFVLDIYPIKENNDAL